MLDKKEEYLQWFVGFVDAEGNFYTNKNFDTQTFQIHLSMRDKENLYKMKEILGFGEVYEDPKNNRVQISVTRKELLYNKLIPIFDKYPLLTRKCYQYEAWKEILIKRVNKEKFEKTMNFQKTGRVDITTNEILKNSYYENWVMGFIEGEGSFSIINSENTLRPQFSICQQFDIVILNAMKEKFNINSKVYLDKGDVYRLQMKSKKDLTTLIRFIENSKIPFQGFKNKQYQIWYYNISLLDNYKTCLN